MKYWGGSETIISKTLQLLSDLSVGYGTVRKLVKLDEVGFLLSHHTAEHYPFLGVGVSVTEMRCRSMFYTSLVSTSILKRSKKLKQAYDRNALKFVLIIQFSQQSKQKK